MAEIYQSVFCYWEVRELGVEGTGAGCEKITDEPTGCGLCGKKGGEDCEREGHSDDRVIIELQMDVS
jgi:hypothetical protein